MYIFFYYQYISSSTNKKKQYKSSIYLINNVKFYDHGQCNRIRNSFYYLWIIDTASGMFKEWWKERTWSFDSFQGCVRYPSSD